MKMHDNPTSIKKSTRLSHVSNAVRCNKHYKATVFDFPRPYTVQESYSE